MEILKYLLATLFIVTVFFIFIFAVSSRKFLKTLFFNAFLGLASLAIIYLTKSYTGVFIPINSYTAGVGGILGLPGIIGLLVLNFIFL